MRCRSAPIGEAWSPSFCHIWFVIGRAAVRMVRRVYRAVGGFLLSILLDRFYEGNLPGKHHSVVSCGICLPSHTYSISFCLLLVDTLFVMNININRCLPDVRSVRGRRRGTWLRFGWNFRKQFWPGHAGEREWFPSASVCSHAEICAQRDLSAHDSHCLFFSLIISVPKHRLSI